MRDFGRERHQPEYLIANEVTMAPWCGKEEGRKDSATDAEGSARCHGKAEQWCDLAQWGQFQRAIKHCKKKLSSLLPNFSSPPPALPASTELELFYLGDSWEKRILEMELSSSQVQGAICLLDPDNNKLSLWSTAAGISLADITVKVCVCSRTHGIELLACFNTIRTFRAGKVSFCEGKKKFKNAQGFIPHSWKQESVGGNREGGFGSGSEGVVRFQSCQVSKLNSHIPTTWMWAKPVLRQKAAEEGERGRISITPLSPAEKNRSGYCCILWPVFSLSFYLLTACQK